MRVSTITLLLMVALVVAYPHAQLRSSEKVPVLPRSVATPQVTFGAPTPLWQSIRPDLSPAALVTPNGLLWVAWQSNRSGVFNIYLRTFDGISWSIIQSLSKDPFNASPSLARLTNGTIILIWSSGTNGYDDHLVYRTFTNGVWRDQTQLTSGSSFTDESAKAVVSRDATLWVFFERDTPTGPTTAPTRQLYYKTLMGNVWSADTQYTVDSSANVGPTAMVSNDGNLWVAWSRGPAAGGASSLFYRTYNGTAWSSDQALTLPGTSDSQPSLVQDRNGTIWLFWARPVALSPTVSQSTLFYKFSYDVARTWSSETQLSNWGSVSHPVDNIGPFAVQGFDTTIWVFFATNIVPIYDFDIYYMQSSTIYPVHAVTVSNIQVSGDTFHPRTGFRGMYPYGYNAQSQMMATITVTVYDPGDFNENVILTLQAINGTNSVAMTVTQAGPVAAGVTASFPFSWNVSGVFPGRYTLLATIAPVAGETPGNILGNSLSYKPFIIFLAGDVNYDGQVNTGDFVVMGQAYGSLVGDPRYLPDGDLNRNGRIDTGDFVAAARNYGKKI